MPPRTVLECFTCKEAVSACNRLVAKSHDPILQTRKQRISRVRNLPKDTQLGPAGSQPGALRSSAGGCTGRCCCRTPLEEASQGTPLCPSPRKRTYLWSGVQLGCKLLLPSGARMRSPINRRIWGGARSGMWGSSHSVGWQLEEKTSPVMAGASQD